MLETINLPHVNEVLTLKMQICSSSFTKKERKVSKLSFPFLLSPFCLNENLCPLSIDKGSKIISLYAVEITLSIITSTAVLLENALESCVQCFMKQCFAFVHTQQNGNQVHDRGNRFWENVWLLRNSNGMEGLIFTTNCLFLLCPLVMQNLKIHLVEFKLQ